MSTVESCYECRWFDPVQKKITSTCSLKRLQTAWCDGANNQHVRPVSRICTDDEFQKLVELYRQNDKPSLDLQLALTQSAGEGA